MATRKRKQVISNAAGPKSESVMVNPSEEKTGTTSQQAGNPPVPPQEHYRVFKNVENRVREQLAKLDHEYFFTGLRVAYDLKDSFNEPFVMPYSFEFGDLKAVDAFLNDGKFSNLTENELRIFTKEAAIQYNFLKDLYEEARTQLEAASPDDLNVGVFVVVNGSGSMAAAMTCRCSDGSHKRVAVVSSGRSGEKTKTCGQACRSTAHESPPRSAHLRPR